MQIQINYDQNGTIVSYQAGDPSGNLCPSDCQTITIDDSLQKFDPFTMKVVNGSLALK